MRGAMLVASHFLAMSALARLRFALQTTDLAQNRPLAQAAWAQPAINTVAKNPAFLPAEATHAVACWHAALLAQEAGA